MWFDETRKKNDILKLIKTSVACRILDGWLDQFTAAFIYSIITYQSSLGMRGNVAEIGVHHGKSFLPLSLALSAEEISIAIDVFEEQHYNLDRSGRGNRNIFLKNMYRFGIDLKKVMLLQKNSLEICPNEITRFGGLLRAISIDGSHTEIATYSDLLLGASTLSEYGLIFLDDVYNLRWPEVVGGLQRFLEAGGMYIPVAVVPGKVMLCRKDYVAFYSKYLRTHLANWIDYEKTVLGFPCLGLGVNSSYFRRMIAMTRVGRIVKRIRAVGRLGFK
jgi:hypothetical protein